MAVTSFELLLRRDRLFVFAALAALASLSWAYLFWMAASPAMDASTDQASMAGMASMSAGLGRWSPAQFLTMLLMWAVMMIGMMTPSVAPMILIYARVARQASTRGTPFASSGWFAFGYFLAWSGFALAATLLQWGMERALLLSPMMATTSPLLGGALLIAAGLYQWTPLKDACLSQCQSPLAFIQRHGGFRPQRGAALSLGLRHGGYCIGCCWALMALLFVAGVMNLLWIAALGALVLAEKLVPSRLFQRIMGIFLMLAGAAQLA
jgi:predicted metal-binding membrane protein